MEYAKINGIDVPVYKTLTKDKVYGLSEGSILIISHMCEVSAEIKEYCDLRKINILRIL